MKVYHLPLLIFAGVACASQPPVEPVTPSFEAAKQGQETPSISASPSSQARLRFTEMAVQDTKSQDIGTIKLQETNNSIVVLFETKKLSPGKYQVRIEDNCNEKSSRKAGVTPENLVKEFRIQGQDFSDEFKMRGYSFDEQNPQSLKNKSIKLYQVGNKSELKLAACGAIQL